MRHKSEVKEFLIAFGIMVRNHFSTTVKKLRTDNGTEFQSSSMLNYYHKNGILLETSCTDTPQQNGVVKRKHGHISEVARALRFESGLPVDFWTECVLTATYIINRLPSRVLKGKTPYKILFNKQPNYDHVTVFGCLVYAKDNRKGRERFDWRGRRCVFVGYPHLQKGYRVFDLETKQIYTSRDVKFFKDIFPFKNATRVDDDNKQAIDNRREEPDAEIILLRNKEWADDDFLVEASMNDVPESSSNVTEVIIKPNTDIIYYQNVLDDSQSNLSETKCDQEKKIQKISMWWWFAKREPKLLK